MRITLLLLLFIAFGAAHSQEYEATEKICRASEEDAEFALSIFDSTHGNSTQPKIESVRHVYSILVRMKRTRIEEIRQQRRKESDYDDKKEDRFLQLMFRISSKNYRFALCERYRRPDASSAAIAIDTYERCKGILDEKLDEDRGFCF